MLKHDFLSFSKYVFFLQKKDIFYLVGYLSEFLELEIKPDIYKYLRDPIRSFPGSFVFRLISGGVPTITYNYKNKKRLQNTHFTFQAPNHTSFRVKITTLATTIDCNGA